MRLVGKLLVLAAAFWVVAAVVPGVHVRDRALDYLVIGALFAVVNVVVRPLLKLLSFPLLLVTLGLFLVVINAAVLGLTALLTDRLAIDGVGPAVLASLLLSVVTWLGETVLGVRED